MKATTLSCSTIHLSMSGGAAGSPPSSPKINLTGGPAKPPRVLTSALQALLAVMIGCTARPITPLPVPSVPKRIGVLAAAGPGGPGVPGVPGAGAAVAEPAATPAAGLAPDGTPAGPAAPTPEGPLAAGRVSAMSAAPTAPLPPVAVASPDGVPRGSSSLAPLSGAAAGGLVPAASAPWSVPSGTTAAADESDRAPPVAVNRARSTREPHPATRTATASARRG